jgi:peptidoglycan-associated lipoprotein
MFFFFVATFPMVFISCQRSGGQAWEDVKTAGRYINRGIDTLCGKNYDSKQYIEDDMMGPVDEEFIPLDSKDISLQYKTRDTAISQSKMEPGKKGIPNLDKFQEAPTHLRSIFKMINFETDDHVVRNREDLYSVQKIVAFMKKNPNYYLCIEGHCDERASAAYNMALGTRRANHVRVLLIKQGVDFNRIYTVSYGKEKPLALNHSSDGWNKNRRSEFKLFEKK